LALPLKVLSLVPSFSANARPVGIDQFEALLLLAPAVESMVPKSLTTSAAPIIGTGTGWDCSRSISSVASLAFSYHFPSLLPGHPGCSLSHSLEQRLTAIAVH